MIEVVDLLDAKTIQTLFELRTTLPEDTPEHRRRRLEYRDELLAALPPVEGHLAGDPQAEGTVFIPDDPA